MIFLTVCSLVSLILLATIWEVPILLLGFVGSLLVAHWHEWVSSSQAFVVVLCPTVYLLVVVLCGLPYRSDVAKLFKITSSFPFGPYIFSRILVPCFVPHKSILRLQFHNWSNKEVTAKMYQRFWLHNPFGSVDLGALISAGEVVGFGVCLSRVQSAGLRAIPVEVNAVFHMKARGEITITSTLSEEVSFPVGTHSHTAQITDKKGTLCAEVTTKFVVSGREPANKKK